MKATGCSGASNTAPVAMPRWSRDRRRTARHARPSHPDLRGAACPERRSELFDVLDVLAEPNDPAQASNRCVRPAARSPCRKESVTGSVLWFCSASVESRTLPIALDISAKRAFAHVLCVVCCCRALRRFRCSRHRPSQTLPYENCTAARDSATRTSPPRPTATANGATATASARVQLTAALIRLYAALLAAAGLAAGSLVSPVRCEHPP